MPLQTRSCAPRPLEHTPRHEVARSKWPNDSDAHFAMGYVLRYVGLSEEAAKECETAIRLDPTNLFLRSCGFPYVQMGNWKRA